MSVEEDLRDKRRSSYASHSQRQRAVRKTFDFLNKKEDYSVVEVEDPREFCVVYGEPSKKFSLVISWGYSEVVPVIYFRAGTPEDGVAVKLQQILGRLGIVVDTSAFPSCDKLANLQGFVSRTAEASSVLVLPLSLSAVKSFWINSWRKREVLREYPRFLEAYGNALRENHGVILKELHEAFTSLPAK